MRFALLEENDKVFVEFKEEDMIRILRFYYDKNKNFDEAIEGLKTELRRKMRSI